MADSITEQVLARIATVAGSTGLAPATRDRQTAITRDESPYITVEPSNENTQVFSDWADQTELDVEIRITTRGDLPSQLADPIRVAVHAALMNDDTLDLVVQRIRRAAATWAFDDADQTVGTLTCRYRVTYLSSAVDLTRQPIQ